MREEKREVLWLVRFGEANKDGRWEVVDGLTGAWGRVGKSVYAEARLYRLEKESGELIQVNWMEGEALFDEIKTGVMTIELECEVMRIREG